MYDLHCHLLPGIDDGPDTMDQALAMARHAVASGITHSIVTPHVHPDRYDNDHHSIQSELSSYKSALRAAQIPLQIGMAGEVRLSAEILTLVEENRIPFLGEWQGNKVMLLEFPHGHIPPGSDKLVEWLLKRDILPMIAHPERNKGVMRDRRQLEPFVKLGCLFQVTAGSVAGNFGGPAQRCAEDLLAAEVVTVLASDAHNLNSRPPELRAGVEAASRIIGEANAQALVVDNPVKLVGSQFDD